MTSQPSAALIHRVRQLSRMLRPTPVVRLDDPDVDLFAKLEFANPVGSIKDRPAFWILKKAIERGDVNERTTIIESSSGNFALALSTFCKLLGLKFIPVIDPNISPSYEDALRRNCSLVVKVEERDETGGFLKTRLRKIEELQLAMDDVFWTNQYANPDGMEAHYTLTGGEICEEFPQLDYAFLGVSSGGTIAGVSRRLKEHFPSIRIVAVDAEGSVIFGQAPKKRYIPGIGSSIVPELVTRAVIDSIEIVPELDTVQGCRDLLEQHAIFAGGSSGTVYAAIRRVAKTLTAPDGGRARVLFLCPDRGLAYLNTVFDPVWSDSLKTRHAEIKAG